MSNHLQNKKSLVGCFIILFTLFFIGVFSLFNLWIGLRLFYNDTRSAPQGVYIGAAYHMDTFSLGDYVIMELPYKVGKLNQGYLMLKQVKGFPGDEFDVLDTHLFIRGLIYPIMRNVPELPQMGPGHYSVPDYHYLLLNDPVDSFDCRYLGPVHRKHIKARAMLLFTYERMNSFLSHFSWILSLFK